jgi:hypothetical protein
LAVHVVTGGAGFIGFHIAEALVGREDKVIVLDNLSTGKLENLRGVESSIEFRELDLVREASLERHLVGVDTVFHQGSDSLGSSLDQRPGGVPRSQCQCHAEPPCSVSGCRCALRRLCVVFGGIRRQPGTAQIGGHAGRADISIRRSEIPLEQMLVAQQADSRRWPCNADTAPHFVLQTDGYGHLRIRR